MADNSEVQVVPQDDKTLTDEKSPSPPANPMSREQLIDTAVKFLKNPNVQNSPLEQKTLFLKKKGLTDDEVNRALQIFHSQTAPITSNVPPTQNQNIYPYHGNPFPNGYPLYAPPPPPSVWAKARETSFLVIIVGGATYGIYQFLKQYVFPVIFGFASESDRIKQLEKSVAELQSMVNQTLLKLTDTLQEVHSTLTANQDKLDEVLTTAQASTSIQRIKDTQTLQELKGEIVSLKGLLLSRRSFPPPPNTTSLPAWQLQLQNNQKPSPTSKEEQGDAVSDSGGSADSSISPKEVSIDVMSDSKSWEIMKPCNDEEPEDVTFA